LSDDTSDKENLSSSQALSNDALRNEMSERASVEDARMQLLSQLVSAQEDERRRFALDLHDQLGQQITALRIKLETISPQIEDQKVKESIDELQAIVKQLDADVDFLAWQLRPIILDDLGLAPALANYVKQWSEHFGIAGEFRPANFKDVRFSTEIETNLYRIVQEALNNCAKHARCSRAQVLLERKDHHAVLIVEDDGVGFEPESVKHGDGRWGLLGMRERTSLLRGAIEIESAPNKGTTIFVRVPLSESDGG
jgi:signal transduction histidine kinase